MLMLLLIGVTPAVAAEPIARASASNFRRGSVHVGFLTGYGHGFRVGSKANRQSSRELARIRLIEFIPRVGFGLTDPLAADAWYHGNVEMLIEGAFFFNAAQNGGVGGGIGNTLRYNFLFADTVVPFLDANFGVIGLNLDLSRQSDGLNFNVGFGGGTHWLVSDSTAITTELRWQHISNAGTDHPNDGINIALFLVGVSYFFH